MFKEVHMKNHKIALTALLTSILSLTAVNTVSADISNYASWKQSGESWSSDIIGSSGETISEVGCKIVSTAIQLVRSGAVTDDSFNPGVLNAYFSSHGGYNGSGMNFTAADGYNGSDFSYEGSLKLTDTYLKDHTKELVDYYNKGLYMVMGVSYNQSRYDTNHWVAIEKYDATVDRWYMNDPASGTQDDPFNFYKYTPNCVHVYSCSSEPFRGVKVSSSTVKEAADAVEEISGNLVENTHRLSEYSDSQKATLAILENKTLSDAEYEAFKWNMVVSQFNIPYCESISDTLNNNSAWSKFFSDGLRFNSNAYLNSIDSYIDDTDKLKLENYVSELRKDITTPIIKTTTLSGSISDNTDLSGDVITVDDNFVDNKWAAFLVSPDNPAYKNTLECKAILDQLSQDSSIGSVVSASYSKSNPNSGKTFISMNKDLKDAPGIGEDTEEIDCGGVVDTYANGKISEIPQSFFNAMITDMHKTSECSSAEFGDVTKSTGMGYRTFYQASYADGSSLIANVKNGLWTRTLGMFSEHCTGTAVDFQLSYDELTNQATGTTNSTGDSKADQEFNWLADNAHKYGFIWRYKVAGNKTDTIYEGWHWRFVGVNNATTFWKKCSSDGINGYDTNDEYTWEDYYNENIKNDPSYPKTYYDAIVNMYKEDTTKCTYDQYSSGKIETSKMNTNDLNEKDYKIESSLILQAYDLLKHSDNIHSEIYNEKDEVATLEDLFNDNCLYIKDNLAVAGKELVYTDNIEIDLPTLSLATNEESEDEVSDNSLVKSLWDSLKDYGSITNGTTQSVWDSVLEANHNQTIKIPVYINSDISTMYNSLFVANAIRKCGYGNYNGLISAFKGCNLSTDSYGNICISKGGKYYVVYPAYANTLYTEISNDTVIGKVFQSISGIDITKSDLQSMIDTDTFDSSSFITGAEVLSECILKSEFNKELTQLDWTQNTNIMPTLIRVDSENTCINNKLILSLYSRNYEPVNSGSWHDTIVGRRNKYKAYDLENYSKLYEKISNDSKFYNTVMFNRYEATLNDSTTDKVVFDGTTYTTPIAMYTTYRSNILNPFMANLTGGLFNSFFGDMDIDNWHPIYKNWNNAYDKSFNDYCWLDTNFNFCDSITGSVYNITCSGNNKYMYSMPVYQKCFVDSEEMCAFTPGKDSQNSSCGGGVFEAERLFKQNKLVSDAIEDYPIEDIIYVSYIWNKNITSRLDISKISLVENNLDKVFYSDNLINTTNIISEDNNKIIYFTKSSDCNNGMLFLKDGYERNVFKANNKIYAVRYNLPLLMLGVNKNAYGDNLDRMVADLQSGSDAEVSLLDKMWEISTNTASSFKFLFLSFCQINHNNLSNTGLGNPFVMTSVYRWIVNNKIYLFAISGAICAFGVLRYSISFIIKYKSKRGLIFNISKVMAISLVPVVLVIFTADLINGISSLLIDKISLSSSVLNLEQTKRKDNLISDDEAIFYDVVKDSDKGFYSMAVKLPGDEKSTLLYKLYTDVSFDTWYTDNSQTMPWYNNSQFIPVHYNKYGDSVFYYFYDYLMYQYLGYNNKLGSDQSKEVIRKYVLPEVTDSYNYESYKNACKVCNKQFLALKDNVLSMYKSNNYPCIEYKDKMYVKDLLGFYNMFNMCEDSKLLYKPPISSYFNNDIKEWSRDVNDTYLSNNLFDSYIKGSQKVCYPIARIMLGKQGEVFNDLKSITKHNMSDYSLIKFTPTYLQNELKSDYDMHGYDLNNTSVYNKKTNSRAPWKLYASQGYILNNFTESSTVQTEFEKKLTEINNRFYNDVYKFEMTNVSDDTMIFSLALEATFKFNDVLDNPLNSVATPVGISPDGLTSDTVSKSLYLNNVKDVSGYNFTYAMYKKYSIITVIAVVIQEILLFVCSLAKLLLVILLFAGSIRLILIAFMSDGEIKELITATIRQLLICLVCHGFVMFTILFSINVLSVYSNMAFLVSLMSSVLYIVILNWTVLQIKSMLKEFKTMGSRMIKSRCSEVASSVGLVLKTGETVKTKYNRMLIHKAYEKPIEKLSNKTNKMDYSNLQFLKKKGGK